MARRVKDFFENFRATAARTAAVTAVRLAERNLVRRMRYWEKKQMPGMRAVDPREDVTGMTTNQIKAYTKRLRNYTFDTMQPAGIATASGELLPVSDYQTYVDLWNAREREKEQTLQSLKLKGIPQNPKIALVDVDPTTGQLKPERGGNYVLQRYGDVQIPKDRKTLERRIKAMQGWKSIAERIETSNGNVEKKLAVISTYLLQQWQSLSTAQKQYLINNENIFDYLNALTISTDIWEVRRYFETHKEDAENKINYILELIENARRLEPEE